MPLEYVCSNAGHPMLLIDHYTFHRHSSNPKSGRINWRCSRRRVKDIRCPSSCYSVNEQASRPTPHDPSCHPLNNAELSSYNVKRDRFNTKNVQKFYEDLKSSDNGIKSNESINFQIQNRDIDSDEEELNDVLNNLDEQILHQNDPDELKIEISSKTSSPSNNNQNNSNDTESTGYQSTSNTISAIIEETVRMSKETNLQRPYQRRIYNALTRPLPTTSPDTKNSIYFVTSKVGHPMLVVDQYTFHKHSTNPKTNRVNWRCSRRRVKEIRCPSSCYTVEGDVSNPTPHDIKCQPISGAMLKNYENKRININPGGNGMTMLKQNLETIKNNINNEFVDYGARSYSNEEEDDEFDDNTNEDELNRPRNKRKESLPIRTNENSDEVDDGFHSSNNLMASNDDNNIDAGDDNYVENDIDNHVLDEDGIGQEDYDDNFYDNEFAEYDETVDNENDDYLDYGSRDEEADLMDNNTYDGCSDNFTPQSFERVVCQLNDLKKKYRISTGKLKW